MGQQHPIAVQNFSHICIGVSDIEASVTFYTAVLGMDVVFDVELEGAALGAVTGGAAQKGRMVGGLIGGAMVELLSLGAVPDVPSGPHLGYTNMSFRVDDLDATYDSVRRHHPDVRADPAVDIGGVRMFFIYDPDGTPIELLGLPDGVTGVTQYWFDGYDESAVRQFASSMEGVYFLLQHAPFEVTELDPGTYPGMDRYEALLQKYAPGNPPSEASLAGWQSADLFVTGLRALGRDVTRSRLVHSLNTLTSYTADGLEPPIDWTIAHKPINGPLNCTAFVVVHDGRFVPAYGEAPSVFSCFPQPAPATGPITTVTPLPAGVPPLPAGQSPG